jgi:hypothetical protein
MRLVLPLTAALLLAGPAFAQRVTFDDVVKKIEAKVEPVKAKRGETVQWTLSLELTDGWHTYPTKQPDPKHSSFVNKMKFENSAAAVFVGELKEPDAMLRIEDGAKLAEIEGFPVWERAVVVRPDATPGKVKLAVPVSIQVCDKTACLPPKKVTVEVELTISDAPPVAVDAKYQKEVEAAGKK